MIKSRVNDWVSMPFKLYPSMTATINWSQSVWVWTSNKLFCSLTKDKCSLPDTDTSVNSCSKIIDDCAEPCLWWNGAKWVLSRKIYFVYKNKKQKNTHKRGCVNTPQDLLSLIFSFPSLVFLPSTTWCKTHGYALRVVSLLDQIPHFQCLILGWVHLLEQDQNVGHQVAVIKHANKRVLGLVIDGCCTDPVC